MNKLDNKTFAIGMLSLGALVLLVANFIYTPTAQGVISIKDRDYQAVTARISRGGEALYLTDNRTGKMAVFVYDPSKRGLVVLAVAPISNAFGGAAVPAGGGKGVRGGAGK